MYTFNEKKTLYLILISSSLSLKNITVNEISLIYVYNFFIQINIEDNLKNMWGVKNFKNHPMNELNKYPTVRVP